MDLDLVTAAAEAAAAAAALLAAEVVVTLPPLLKVRLRVLIGPAFVVAGRIPAAEGREAMVHK